MKILPSSSIDLNCLKQALLTNENGAEFRIISFSFDLDSSDILVDLIDTESHHYGACSFSSLSNWSIQLSSGHV